MNHFFNDFSVLVNYNNPGLNTTLHHRKYFIISINRTYVPLKPGDLPYATLRAKFTDTEPQE